MAARTSAIRWTAAPRWREPKTVPQDKKSGDGFIAVSADGRAWVWTPKGGVPHVSHDRGDSWTAVKGLPAGTRVIADRVNPMRLHAMALFERQALRE